MRVRSRPLLSLLRLTDAKADSLPLSLNIPFARRPIRLAQLPTDNEEESLNTLFVRTILLSMLVLISVHACVTLLVSEPAAGGEDRALQTAVFTGRAFANDPLDSAGGTWGAPVERISLVPATMKLDLAARPRIVDVRPAVYEAPAAGVLMDIAAPSTPGSSNGLRDDSPLVGDVPASPLDSRFAVAEWVMSLVMLILACFSLWRVQRPLRNVAHAARETACGHRVAPTVREEGPSELRHVVRAFNEMARRRNEAIEAQAAVLAGLARHMEYQAARLRTRALEVSEWNKRVGFVEDIDSFSDIAQQLLDVAGHGDSEEQQVSVDGFLRDRFSMIGTMDGALFACDLKAGPQFMMSRPLLERLMTNLVDNALAHGEPPIEIRTSRDQHGWHLSVRDHGPGISASQMPGATQSFVRLNETHSLTQHWGLGLSVVARLARSCGASLKLGNHPDGGLWVRLVLPTN
jgi:two-component system, OmpR family, osmolarity sensor histidine kinase EnvZ